MAPLEDRHGMCPHCGEREARRLGPCTVCGRSVCEHCGNVQMAAGEHKIMHRECIKKDGGQFRMIKFVK
jgi:hypothetical protein